MELYRLGSCKFSADTSGEGSRLYGGRWNTIGVPAVYFASSRALAVLEVLVHLPPALLPSDFCMAILKLETIAFEITENQLPTGWNTFPFLKQVQLIGNSFFKEGKHLLLKVPSAVVSGEFNYIMNPKHKQAKDIVFIKNEPFSFDSRLF
ncbi:RES family NAD+ phosphorylase [Pedobacter cryophilus]|uniref:RES domain-containing protein n=1 Tax=Pedobacter cryophilus TaxID=2571271 RepID=A0A4U1C1S3_9SPHI|nr:RES family NAD+ phosphorylase [Pedobacter cryophilus]TKB97027.1 RES domain-containing protein [Pedobacter cryophilus]